MTRWIQQAAAAALVLTTLMTPAMAQKTKKMTGPVMPQGVLLFPAVVNGATGATQKEAQEIVTEALRKYLTQAGVGITVYSTRLPSVERAIKTDTSLKQDDAAGPGDDTRKAQRLADLVGANEYITVSVDDYKYDATSRTATFNLSVFRNATSDAAPLGTAAQGSQGVAPVDVSASRQQGSAVARAAETAAQQVTDALFPRPKVDEKMMDKKAPGNHKKDRGTRAVIFGGAGALLLLLAL